MTAILIAIGANLPSPGLTDPYATCLASVAALRDLPHLNLRLISRWYRTEPIPRAPDQPDFCNGALLMQGGPDLDPENLLASLHAIEARFGRHRTIANAARPLDLDLIAIDQHIRSTAPILPHPRAHLRRFVLDPICDIAPDWVHPLLHAPASALRARLIATDPQRIMLW
jgi:2-amino-4-hydroxy-6-hydroxymethyldihydropteridine diphosphokinase